MYQYKIVTIIRVGVLYDLVTLLVSEWNTFIESVNRLNNVFVHEL